MRSITIGLIQMGMVKDVNENLSKAIDYIEKAARKGAEIICLPELFSTLYFPQKEKGDVSGFAEEISGYTTNTLSNIAKKNRVILIGGSILEKKGSKFYNTSTVFNEDGKLLGIYRKIHIPHDPCFYEKNYFSPGDLGYKVFKTRYCNISVLICYDQWFPEAARISALMGADIIFYPTAIGHIKGSKGWQEAWEKVQIGHAISNNVIVAPVNRVGREGNINFWGGSFVCGQFGRMIKHGGNEEGIIIAECDLGYGRKVREEWGFFRNRRPETYGKIGL